MSPKSLANLNKSHVQIEHWNDDANRWTRPITSSAACKDFLKSFSSSSRCFSFKWCERSENSINWADFEVYPNCFELGDSIYDEANPKTSGLKKDLIYNEANLNLFVSSSPEPPNIYAAASSFIQSRWHVEYQDCCRRMMRADRYMTIIIFSSDLTQVVHRRGWSGIFVLNCEAFKFPFTG